MGFFGALTDIYKNQGNFKKWEKNERDKDAQRKVLHQQNIGQDRLELAKKRGDVIIDVITKMDQHSENMSQDIESVSEPVAEILQTAGMLGGMAAFGKMISNVVTKNDSRKEKFIKDNNLEEVAKQVIQKIQDKRGNEPKDKLFKELPYVNKYNFLEEKTFKKYSKHIDDKDLLKQVQKYMAEYKKQCIMPTRRGVKFAIVTGIAIPVVTFIASILASTKIQLDGSRVARWQSRENLKDVKNFVVYTPEQIEQAKENLEQQPKPKLSWWQKLTGKKNTDKNNQGFFKNWYSFIKDKKAYNRWKANDKDESKLVTRELTEQEIQDAKLDQELIQRMTKKINNKAEEYSENMETAAATILGSSLLGGALFGWITSSIINKLGVGDKFAKKYITKNTSKEFANEIIENQKKSKTFFDKVRNIFETNVKIEEYFMQNGEEKELASSSKKISKNALKKIKTMLVATPMTRNFILSSIASIFTTIATISITLKLQKNASRAGRYVAREEFKNNPQEYISYTDEEMEQVKDVKGKPKTLGETMKNWLGFVPTAVKQMYRYEKYKNTEMNEKENLRKELIKLDVSEEQLKDAKNLQNKLYNTFEKVDEKSQAYSENMEAMNQMIQPVIQFGALGMFFAPFALVALGVAKGKISIMKLTNWTTSLFTKFSGLMKTKMFKNQITQSADKIINSIEKTKVIGSVPGLGNNDTKSIYDLIGAIFSGKVSLSSLGLKAEQISAIKEKTVKELIEEISSASPELKKFVEKYNTLSSAEKINFIKSMIDEKLVNLPEQLRLEIKNKVDTIIKPEEIDKFLNTKLGEKIKIEDDMIDFSKLIDIKGNIAKFKNLPAIKNINSENVFNAVRAFITAIPKETFNSKFANISSKEIIGKVQLGKIDKDYVLKTLDKLEKVCNNFPNDVAKKEFARVFKTVLENPDKFMYMLKNNPEEFAKMFKTDVVSQVMLGAGLSWGVITTLFTYLLESYFASMQKDAGRLGVMKAIEDLGDYRYYADENKTNK